MGNLPALTMAILLLGLSIAASAGSPLRDDFNSRIGWRGPIYQCGDRTTGDATTRDGVLTITRNPGGPYHMVSMGKDFFVDFRPNTVIQMRFRLEEPLLGADMYATFTLDGRVILQMGINGEQHWKMFENCVRKTWDDEFFFGSDVIRGEDGGKKKNDIRVALPDRLKGKIRYTDWHVFSMKYDVSGDERKIRLYVDGQEITYRDLDAAFPAGVVDNRVIDDFRPKPSGSKLKISLGIMADGDLYGDTSVHEGAGVRWLHAFADNTPAVPSPLDPKAATKKTSRMLWDYIVIACDGVEGNR